jgi:hypothetical protein
LFGNLYHGFNQNVIPAKAGIQAAGRAGKRIVIVFFIYFPFPTSNQLQVFVFCYMLSQLQKPGICFLIYVKQSKIPSFINDKTQYTDRLFNNAAKNGKKQEDNVGAEGTGGKKDGRLPPVPPAFFQ